MTNEEKVFNVVLFLEKRREMRRGGVSFLEASLRFDPEKIEALKVRSQEFGSVEYLEYMEELADYYMSGEVENLDQQQAHRHNMLLANKAQELGIIEGQALYLKNKRNKEVSYA